MRIIDDGDGVRLRIVEMLHTTGDTYRFHIAQRFLRGGFVEIESNGMRNGNGCGGIRIIEITIQLQAERADLLTFHRNGESAMVGGFRPCDHIRGRCFAKSERGDGNIGDCSILTNKIGMCACRAENQGTAILHNLTFAVEVILECRMLDGADMVRADIEECGDVESNSENTINFVGLRRNLHNQVFHAVISGFAHHTERIHGLRGGQIGLDIGMSVKAIIDGGEQCAFAAGAAVEHGLGEVGGSGFSLGSGNADDFQLVLRVPIECRGQQTHGFARVIHDESRSFRRRGEVVFRNVCGKTTIIDAIEIFRFETAFAA